jgi:HSP20 family molecular chaperone IbpA
MEMTMKNLQRHEATHPQEAQPREAAQRQDAAPQNVTPLLPSVDIVESPEAITLTADMPGVAKENLSISVEGDNLTIEGGLTLHESAKLQAVYAEVRVAHYKRTFVLSNDLDTEKIEAKLNNGVLTLHIPKREQVKPRRIEVKAL